MSDPRYTDPPMEPPLERDPNRLRRNEAGATNALWGWIAGGVVIVLLLLFIFGRSGTDTNSTASNPNPTPPVTTGQAPSPPPAAKAPAPSTTGQTTPK